MSQPTQTQSNSYGLTDEEVGTPLIMAFPQYKLAFEACEAMFERCVPSMPVFMAVAMAIQDLAGEEEITDEDQHFDLDRIIRAAVSLRLLVDLARKVNNEIAFPADSLPSDELLRKVEIWFADHARRQVAIAMGANPDSLQSLPRPADAILDL